MAKIDRSILSANDQSMGDFGDPNKLESSISHLADKIDENDTGFNSHKDAAELAHPDKSVTERKLADSSVSSRTIQAGAVGTRELDPAILAQPTTSAGVQAKLKEHDDQLVEKANRRTNVFNKQTYGTYGDAAVLSAMANELEENPRPQVLGLTSTQHASDYADRDSVAFYTSNRSRKPTVVANSGAITYTGTSVQVTGSVLENLDKVLPGMLIDTYHIPDRWTAFVESVDIASQTITTKDGWYKVQPGGSQTPSTPTNGVGFDVNRLTKVWAINDNVFLYDEDGVDIAVAAEIGLFNYRNGATSMAGFDLVNFANKADYGYQARKSSGAVGGYGYAYVARDSDNAFMAHTTSEDQILLRSELNGDSNEKGFVQYANGAMSKLRLLAGLFGDGQNIYGSPNQSIFLINKSVEEIFRLPSPVGKAGEMIVVLNVGSATSTLANENDSGVIVNGTSFVSVRLPRRQSVIFVSDGGAWYSIGLNGLSHQQGTTAPTTTPAFIGQEFIDTTNRRVYKAVGVSSSTDWVPLN